MSIINREDIQRIINDDWLLMDDCEGNKNCDVVKDLARIALALLEAEPVAYIRAAHNPDGFCFADGIHPAHRHQKLPLSTLQDGCYWTVTPLYTAPPAPVSVPDEALKRLLPDAEKAEFWFEHEGKILFEGVKFNNAVFEACHAAMLQGAENAESEPITKPAPVLDSVAKNADSGPGSSPVIPDGWIPVSERMPDKLIPVMVMYEDGEMWSAMWNGNSWDDGTEYPDPHEVAHWREMPAAPQQEAK
ncbi:TPA: DUF551 domain-containing protein [Citrobacter freundii]